MSSFLEEYKTKDVKIATHLSLKGGKYFVPESKWEEFYKNYYKGITNGVKFYLVERVTSVEYNFFLDLESKTATLTDEIVSEIVDVVCDDVCDDVCDEPEFIVSKRESGPIAKYHVNFPGVRTKGKVLVDKLLKALRQDLHCYIDTSVYNTGLRVYGSRKRESEGYPVYRLYDLGKKAYVDITYTIFLKMIVRIPGTSADNDRSVEIKHDAVQQEIDKLISNTSLCKYNRSQKVTRSGNVFYATLENFCPFKNRSHKRTSSPVYLMIALGKVTLRCHDIDCSKDKLNIDLPEPFSRMCPEMNLQIPTDVSKAVQNSLSCTHFSVANVAFQVYKDTFRIDQIKSPEWYKFSGHAWKKNFSMNVLLSQEITKYYQDAVDDKVVKNLENCTFKKSVLYEMHHLFKLHDPDFSENLDKNPYLIGFKNGVYDLESCTFRDGRPEDYITLCTGYDYDPDGGYKAEIHEFLAKIIPNKETREYLLKILGRSLLGIPDEHFYIFTGLSGANGKSTLINFLEDTLGDYNVSCDVSLLTNKRGLSSNASPDVIRLKGKRQVTFAEPESKDKLKVGMLKAMTGGDTIVARELYKPPIAFKLQASMFLCCNDLPEISSTDGGTFRRLRVIDFPSRFCDNPQKKNEYKIDTGLKGKLKKWVPSFMTILLDYYGITQQEIAEFGSIKEPESVKAATKKYREENNKFSEFLQDCCTESSQGTHFKHIYYFFTTWWQENRPQRTVPESKELLNELLQVYGETLYNKTKCFKVSVKDDFDSGVSL